MGRISTSIGLITGTPIQETVDQLIKISATGRNMLNSRIEQLKEERTAITDLTVKSISTQLAARAFGSPGAFERTAATSSHPDQMSVVRTGSPAAAKYVVRTLRTASTQGFKTAAVATASDSLGTSGTLTIRAGGFADTSVRLEQLNGGRGVQSGSIRVTDRSGAASVVDLSKATTIDDVIQAINDASGIRVRATADGDSLRLIDQTGASASNLRVEEVGGGSTAADLGLRGVNVAASSANGADVLSLSNATRLDSLRDGRGIGLGKGNDLEITFRNGTAIAVDLADFSRPIDFARGTTDAASADAQLTFTARRKGAEADGMRVRFVDDPSVTAGNETAEIIDGPTGQEIVFRIEEGATTAEDIANAATIDSQIAALVSVTAGGTGAGVVSSDDSATLAGGAEVKAPKVPTVKDLLRVLNSVAPDRIRAEITSDGDAIQLVDLTTGAYNFHVADVGSSTVASDLGLAGMSGTGTLVGGRLSSGLRSVSLGALGGGKGIGPLGQLQITTRDGDSAAVDLSGADTLQAVLNAINESGLDVEASLDSNGAALVLRDLSGGGAGSTFAVTSVDGTAEALGIATSTSDSLLRGADLGLQFVDRATRLDSLNQGNGIGQGKFEIRDSLGQTRVVDLKAASIATVGDLVDAVNGLGIAVEASINETGDGIRLVDNGDGPMDLRVADIGTDTSAAMLGLAGTAVQEVVDGTVVSTINGRQVDVIAYASTDTLSTVAEKIREASRFASATILGGQGGLASLSIVSRRGGEAGRISLGGQGMDWGIQETSRGRDAVVAVGESSGAATTLFRSADGVFDDAIEGLSLTAKQASENPVTIDVAADYSSLESSVSRFVEQYNALIDRIAELNFFNPETNEVGLLFGSSEALRIPGSLARVVTGTFTASDTIRTAGQVGLRLNTDGKLEFDKEKFQAAIDDDPQAVKDFFASDDTGFVAKIDAVVERIAGEDRSLLINRSTELNNQIDSGTIRVGAMDRRLESERNRLLKQFFAMESAIAKMQSNQQYLSTISYIGFDE